MFYILPIWCSIQNTSNKRMDIRKIITGVGMTMIIPGIMAILSIPVCLISGEFREIWGFLITAGISLLFGMIGFFWRLKRKYHVIEMVIIISVGWLLVPLVSVIPIVYHSIYVHGTQDISENVTIFSQFLNAFFETVSGFTSTGLTMASDVTMLPPSLQWWRSFMQWIGGIGIVVMVIFFHNPRLYAMEKFYEKEDFSHVLPNANVNFNKYWWIYLLFTVFSIGLLFFNGVPVWEAINHGMTGVATGGFTITNGSFENYSGNIKIVTIFIMLLGAFSFSLYFQLITKGLVKKFIRNTQVIVFFSLLIAGAFSVVIFNKNKNTGLVDSLFQTVSALATCGFQSKSLNHWSLTPILLLTVLMMIGGTTDSTTGGVKVFRFWIFLKSIFVNSSRILFHPKRPLKVNLYDKKLNSRKRNTTLLTDTYIYLLLWLFIYISGTFLMAHLLEGRFTLEQVLFETSSAFGNVGLSSGITSAQLVPAGKIILIWIMIAGRLELMPVFIILGIIFRSEEKYKKK